MPLGEPKDLTQCRRFFLEPEHPKQRQYEALRRYFIDERPSKEVAHEFGYSEGSFRVLCHGFRRDPAPTFFVSAQPGPRSQPKKSAARTLIEELRKQNHSVYEIADALKERGTALSATAVREVLRELGYAPLPRRLDEERPERHMALLAIASGLYRRLARRMRGYADAQARQVFRDLIDMPADVHITEQQVEVRFHRRAHLPIVIASGLLDQPVQVPWWNGLPLRLSA
jgi:transposase